MISYANTYPGLTKAIEGATEEGEPDLYYPSGKRNYMRTVPADDIQGAAGANWAYETKGARKAYILDDTEPLRARRGPGLQQLLVGAGRRSARLRGLRPERARLPGADDEDRGHGSGPRLRRRHGRQERAEARRRHALADAGRRGHLPRRGRPHQPGVHRRRGRRRRTARSSPSPASRRPS